MRARSLVRRAFVYTVCGIGLFSVCFACFRSEEPPVEAGEAVEIPAAVLYHFGKVSADGAPLKTGDIASGGAVVKTARKSLGNLQLQTPGARIVFLMREKAELKLVALQRGDTTDVTPILKKGRVLVQLEKLSGSERLFVYTPDAHVTVQGTELVVSADANGETAVQVHSGLVRVRPRLPALEELPPEVLDRSQAAGEVLEALDGLGAVVAPGEESRITRGNAEAALALVPGMREELRQITKEIRAGEAAGRSPEELARTLDQKLDEPARELTARVNSTEVEPGTEPIAPPPLITKSKLPLAEREVLRRDFEAIVSVSPAVVNDPEALETEIERKQSDDTGPPPYEEVGGQEAASTNAPAASQDQQLKSLATQLGGSVKVLVLQNGEEKRGVVVNQGEDYLFATPAGQKVYKRDEVREVRLR